MKKFNARKTVLASAMALVLGVGLSACGGGDDDDTPLPTPGNVLALTASNKIISFERATPGTIVTSVGVTGLGAGEQLLGIDVRPADGLLYAVTSAGRILTVNAQTGAAEQKALLRPVTGDAFTALAGASFGVDFNPFADRLRVVSDTGQNLRINVVTGETITDGVINGAAGASVSASAYTNSFAGTSTTTLYALDTTSDSLLVQNPPNAGTLATPIALGVDVTASSGFDIDARTNQGYAALTVGGVTSLYSINLAAAAGTPAATAIAAIGGGEAIKGLALIQPTAPVVFGLTANGQLASFDPATPNTIKASVAIAGLTTGELVLGIDFRPADGKLYGLTSAARIVTIDTTSGAITAVSTLRAAADDATLPFPGLANLGAVYSVDFNPAADRMRVITDTGFSLRINVATGDTTTDGRINRAGATGPSVVAAAYSNSFAVTPAATTTLYDLDASTDFLATQVPPNDGTLVNVGTGLSLDITGATGFDIAGGGNGLALVAVGGATGPTSLYDVSLTTGLLTLRGGTALGAQIGGATGVAVRDIAIKF
ncbi:hypothetical protein BH09PSE5_BH09PSE5_04130 [soil metagenome]